MTVCIPAYNERANIGPLLASVRGEVALGVPIASVLVEVSGSTDGTATVVREFGREWPAVRVLDAATRQGLARAVARLIEEAPTEVVARVDADVRFPPGTIAGLVDAMRDPTVGMTGARIVPASSGHPTLDRILRAEYVLHHLISELSPKLTNVQVFRKFLGRFEDDVETEDILLQELATESGRRPLYLPELTVYVLPPTSLLGLFRQRVRVISSERWYLHRTRRAAAPTTQPSFFVRAVLRGFSTGELGPLDFGLFLIAESLARLYSRARYSLIGHVNQATWPSVRQEG